MVIDRCPPYSPFGHLVRLSRTYPISVVDLPNRYLFSYLDRSALANASIFGFRTDLSLSSVQYNLISTVSDLTRYILLPCSFAVLTYQIFFIVRRISTWIWARTNRLQPYGLLEVPSNIVISYVRPSIWITVLCRSRTYAPSR